jgi:[acyl-carrier-protein] S-malonyltransferase
MEDVAVVGGHSVGELAAAALAGVLTPDAAVALAGVRGREMAAACALEPTSMTAILGGEPDDVMAAIEAAGVYAANRNGAGQVVAAGSREGLDKLAANPPGRSRLKALSVAGAFHTPYMAPAERALAAIAGGITPGTPTKILLSNRDGASIDQGPVLLQRLVEQVTAPVRWDLCMQTIADLGVTAVLELTPAGTLSGLLKRAVKGLEIGQVQTPDDLVTAKDAIARHGSASTHEPHPEFRVIVAGSAGTFSPQADLVEGAQVTAGQVIGTITARQNIVEVTAHGGGTLVEWLAHHDDPVAPGQALARIEA